MANESVTQSTGAEIIGRCKHDTKMVNEVNERLIKMKGVVDLMMCAKDDELAEGTLSAAAWLLFDLISETKAIVGERQEATA